MWRCWRPERIRVEDFFELFLLDAAEKTDYVNDYVKNNVQSDDYYHWSYCQRIFCSKDWLTVHWKKPKNYNLYTNISTPLTDHVQSQIQSKTVNTAVFVWQLRNTETKFPHIHICSYQFVILWSLANVSLRKMMGNVKSKCFLKISSTSTACGGDILFLQLADYACLILNKCISIESIQKYRKRYHILGCIFRGQV